ncbi:MAG: T9SS type A sorting domain-containing protein, partial [Ignavibacteriaceae bacterium]|nr:T9SS type A sorting domain-containing protein [Ignavibacteriaceae bacterium]
FPNPFNPSTNISFSIPSRAFVSLKVFDIRGREIATLINEDLPAGLYTKEWNANSFSSGVYFYRIKAGNFIATKKLVLVK